MIEFAKEVGMAIVWFVLGFLIAEYSKKIKIRAVNHAKSELEGASR